jgi:hypothetical protein
MMKKYAYLSPCPLRQEHRDIAKVSGIMLRHIHTGDPFTLTAKWVSERGNWDGVIVTCPEAALRLMNKYPTGVFESDISDDGCLHVPVALHLFARM